MKYYIQFLFKIIGGLSILGILSFTVAHFSKDRPKSNTSQSSLDTKDQKQVNIDSTRSGNKLAKQTKKQPHDAACGAPSRTSLRKVTTTTAVKASSENQHSISHKENIH